MSDPKHKDSNSNSEYEDTNKLSDCSTQQKLQHSIAVTKSEFEPAFIELKQIYALVDQEIQHTDVCCKCCGQCCDFDHNGLRLYIYHIERLWIMQNLQGNSLCLKQGRCSAQNQLLCGIHEIRPLGCRTQFCSTTLQDIYEKYATKIKALEKKFGIPYCYSNLFC